MNKNKPPKMLSHLTPKTTSLCTQWKSLRQLLQQSKQRSRLLPLVLIFLLVLAALAGFFFLPEPTIVEKVAETQAPSIPLLETAFWLTVLATTFVSFFCLEAIFRSKDTRFLAILPIHPIALFFHKLSSLFLWIGASTLVTSAFWFKILLASPAIGVACVCLWILGLVLATALSFAITLRLSHSNAANQMTQFGPTAFVAAPALALASSVLAILLLKLGLEGILIEGWGKPAIVSTTITLGAIIISLGDAAYQFHKNYYKSLASFLQNDLLVLNANYQFIDEKPLNAIKASTSVEQAIHIKDSLQYNRRFTLSKIVIYLYAIVLTLYFCASKTSVPVFLPFSVILPIFLLAHPWLPLNSLELEPGMIRALPISEEQYKKLKIRSSCKISAQLMIPMMISFIIIRWSHDFNLFIILRDTILTLILGGALILLLSILAVKMRKAKYLPTAMACIILILGMVLI